MLIGSQTYAPNDNYSKILGISKKGAKFQFLAWLTIRVCVSHLVQCQVQELTNDGNTKALREDSDKGWASLDGLGGYFAIFNSPDIFAEFMLGFFGAC